MGQHIKVNTSDLTEIGRTLGTLKSDFENGTDIVGAYRGDIGSDELSDALDDFSSDWSKKRDELCKNLDSLGQCATAAAQTYDGVDAHLAEALVKASEKSSCGEGGEEK